MGCEHWRGWIKVGHAELDSCASARKMHDDINNTSPFCGTCRQVIVAKP